MLRLSSGRQALVSCQDYHMLRAGPTGHAARHDSLEVRVRARHERAELHALGARRAGLARGDAPQHEGDEVLRIYSRFEGFEGPPLSY